MSDLAAWLSNRLDEVEALAKEATDGGGGVSRWRADTRVFTHDQVRGRKLGEPVEFGSVWLDGEVSGPSQVFSDIEHGDVAWGPHCRHAAMWDPETVLRLVAATRALLELHERWELEEYEYTGNPIVTIENGVTYRHWPAGSITGQRQVGVRYECWHCINSDESHMDWPCPTLRAVAAGWGWVDE